MHFSGYQTKYKYFKLFLQMSFNPHSLRAKATAPQEFDVSTKFIGPYDKQCSTQIANVHPLKTAQDNVCIHL